jgi:hypothetical protein
MFEGYLGLILVIWSSFSFFFFLSELHPGMVILLLGGQGFHILSFLSSFFNENLKLNCL